MKKITSVTLAAIFAFTTQTQAQARSATTLRIEKAADAIERISKNFNVIQVEPNQDVKEMILEMVIQQGDIETAEEFDDCWVVNDVDVWGADQMTWAEASAGEAFAYIFDNEEVNRELEDMPTLQKREFLRKMSVAKIAFKDLKNTKVKFGVGPVGAVQCGVTFAALFMIDTETGKIYVISMEGSGC